MESTRKRSSYMHSVYWLLMGLVVWLAGCVSARPDADGARDLPCEAGQVCTLEGRLSAGHPWEAQLENSAGCVALAVPESFASIAPRFHGKRTRVVGKAFTQPISTPEIEMYYYRVRGMRVNENICQLAVVVFSISTAAGDEWVNTDQAPPRTNGAEAINPAP